MAVGDGAALAEALSNLSTVENLKPVLKTFESVSMRRAGQVQQPSLIDDMLWHFPDGKIQEARDAALQPELEGGEFDESPNHWGDPATQN